MNESKHIQIDVLCQNYRIEPAFFNQLVEHGLVKTSAAKGASFVAENQIRRLDQMVRLHQDLELNPQGIDVVLNLLQKIEDLELALNAAMNRLSIHE